MTVLDLKVLNGRFIKNNDMKNINYLKPYLFFLIFVILVFILKPLKAQDKIYKADSSIIEAKVSEITDTEIKYTKFSNPNGPKYTIQKSSVLQIVFENGEKEFYTNTQTQTNFYNQNETIQIKDSLAFIENLWGVKFENFIEDGGGVKIVRIEQNSIFKKQSPFKKLIITNVKSGLEPIRIKNTSELTNALFNLYNKGISKTNLLRNKRPLSIFTNDAKGIDISGLSKFDNSSNNVKKLSSNESRIAGELVSNIYSPRKNWSIQGIYAGAFFGLPGIALMGLVAAVPPNVPLAPPNVDTEAWSKGYKSKIIKKRLVSGLIGSTIGAVLIIAASSSSN